MLVYIPYGKDYMSETVLLNKDDVDIIKKILLRLFVVTDERIIFNDFYFMDQELRDLLRLLKES